MRSQGYGGGGQLTYSPYSRRRENVVYRKANHVSKRGRADAERVSADNLLYSTRGDESPLDTECYYQRAMETLPNDLQHRLSARQEIKAIISDAIASLPLISQRAIKGSLDGWSVAEIAASEGIKESTMEWLLDQAKQRLAEILSEKVGADNGVRYR